MSPKEISEYWRGKSGPFSRIPHYSSPRPQTSTAETDQIRYDATFIRRGSPKVVRKIKVPIIPKPEQNSDMEETVPPSLRTSIRQKISRVWEIVYQGWKQVGRRRGAKKLLASPTPHPLTDSEGWSHGYRFGIRSEAPPRPRVFVSASSLAFTPPPNLASRILDEQRQDPLLQVLFEKTEGFPRPLFETHPMEEFWVRKFGYGCVTKDGILYHYDVSPGKLPESNPAVVPIVPQHLRAAVLHTGHRMNGDHLSTRETLRAIQDKYWWPYMRQDIFYYLDNCAKCARKVRRPFSRLLPLRKPQTVAHLEQMQAAGLFKTTPPSRFPGGSEDVTTWRYGDVVYFKPGVRARLAKPLRGPWEFAGLSGNTALIHRIHPWFVQWQQVATHPGNLTTTRIPPGVMGREQKPFPRTMPVQRFADTFEMIKRHAQLALETRAQKRAMSTAASLVPQNSVCDLGQEVAWTGASKSTSSTIIEVPCYMMTVDSDSGASDTEEIPALPPPPPPPPPRLSAGMDEEEEKRKRRERHKKEEQERRERLRRDDEEWGASVPNRPSRLPRGRGYGLAVPQVPQASTPLAGADRERSRHRPRPLSSPSSDGGPQLPPQPMYAPLPDTGVSPMLRESSGPPPPAAEPVSTASPPPTPYCFRSTTAASLDSSAPSSVKPYDSPADWTPAQRDRRILGHVREVVRRLRLDLGFLATVLRIHFGVEYLQEEDPHPCLNPNIPYGKPSFAPERRPWSSVSENHFTDYAKDLCIKMREAAGLSTPAGKIATMIVAVITGYVGLRDTLSEGAWIPPPTDLGPYMTCMIERVLSYMLYCRMMTRYEHVLTPTVMFKYAPSGYGEPPYDQFHAKAPFERGNVYLLLGFPNAQAFRNHYDVAHQLPQGYPEGGGFVLPGLIPPPSVPPLVPAPEGSSEEVEEEMDTEDQDVSPTAVEGGLLPLAPAQPPSEWTNTAALTLFALQEAALEEAERVNKAALPPISVSEEQALMSLTQASLTTQALPLTTRDPPGTDPIQIVVPFYEEFDRAGYLYGHYRESQLNDRQIPVRTTTGVISRTNSRRTDPGYLAMDRDETNWPYLFHPTVQAAVRRALETMCPPLAAELLCLPSTASREVYRQYGMNPAVFVQQGPITLEHIYRGNNTTDDELIPHALGTDIIGDLVHMGACRGAYRHLQNLKCPNEWAWEQDLCSFVFSPQHAVTKVLAWCRYSIALAVYGVDNFTRTVGDSETQQCPELCYPPAPTQFEVQVFHIWARKMMAANPVDYPEYAGNGPPAWTDADTSNWSFRLACNAIPTIDSVWEAWFTSPRQQFFMANLINITPEDAPAWVNQGCFPLEPNEVWGTSFYRRDTASLNRLLPQMTLRPPGLIASSVTDDYESIFRSALRIVRQRDYADFVEGGKLSSTPLAAPTWPLSRAALRSVIARIRQPYDPDVLMLDGGFYDATQPEIVPDPLIPLSSTELQTLLLESKLYRTAASYCTTMGNWRDILFQCKMFLAGHYQGYDSGELQTWMDNVLDLRRREPVIPRVVETTKLVETILLALYKSGCVSHYPRWRALHFGVREHCQDDTKCCALCWREIPEGGARYQSAGECSHQFHMTCILALVELDPGGEPHCPVCQHKTQIAEPERYKQFQLFPVRDPELRTLDGKVLPTITAPPVLLLMARGPLGPSSLSGSGTHSRPLSRVPSRAPSITDTDNQDVLDLGARDTPFSEHDEAMEVVETPPALLEEQRRQSLEALPGNLAQDYPDVARYLERPRLDDLLLPKLREKMINLLGKTTAQEPIDFYKLLATIPTGPTDRGPTRDHQWTLALSDAIHARIERNEWYHRPDMERWPFWRNLITIYRSEEEKIRQGAAGRVVRDGIYAFLRAVLYYVSPYHHVDALSICGESLADRPLGCN